MFVSIEPKFRKALTQDVIDHIEMSQNEVSEMVFRPILCPYCDQHIVDVFEDMVGHFAVKCQKCKAVLPINAAYFRSSEYVARLKRARLRGEIPD